MSQEVGAETEHSCDIGTDQVDNLVEKSSLYYWRFAPFSGICLIRNTPRPRSTGNGFYLALAGVFVTKIAIFVISQLAKFFSTKKFSSCVKLIFRRNFFLRDDGNFFSLFLKSREKFGKSQHSRWKSEKFGDFFEAKIDSKSIFASLCPKIGKFQKLVAICVCARC